MIQINPLKSYIDGGVRAALTTPPSASLVFDLPGKAIWVKGVKLKGIDHTYTFNHDNYITLTNTPDPNNPESEDIKIGVNITTLKNVIDTTYNGGTLALLQEGLNTEERTWQAKILHNYINNVLPITKNIQINGTNYAIYTTEDSLPQFFAPVSLGTTGQILACTSTGLSWVNQIQNTDYRVSQSTATNDSDYRIILKQGADNNPETNFVRFSEYLTFNPSTKTLKINNIKVVTASDIYVGATAGLVPSATSEQQNYYLRGDGTWVSIATEMAAANTWRPIKVGNTDALGSGTNSGILSFAAGTGITLAWDATNNKITITNSNFDENVRQVPKTDNVNRPLMMINGSTSAGEQVTTSMFSTGIYANASTKMITANGFIKVGSSDDYVLLGGGNHKTLSDFSMAHSHPYLPLAGGTMDGTAWILWPNSGNWENSNNGVTFPVTRGGLHWSGQSDWIKLFSQETSNDNLNLVLQFGDDNSNGLSIRNASGTQTAFISATGYITAVQFNGPLNGNATSATNATNADTVDGIDSTGFLRYYNSNSVLSNVNIVNTPSYVWTVSTTGGSIANVTKPSGMDNAWGVIHLHTHIGNYATQLGFGGTTNRMYMRNAYNTSTFGNWQVLAFTSDIPTSLPANGGNADTVDGYHASSLWRSDGATWNPGANISLNASANSQEWSFDIRRNGYTGCYWHVWDSSLSTMLKVNADNGKVYAPYNFVGSLEGNASSSTKSTYSRSLLGRNTSGSDYGASADNLVFAEWNTMSDNRWYLKATGFECRVNYATNAGNTDTVDGYHASAFATAGHNHDGRYVYNYGSTQMDGASKNKNALGMTTNSGITGDWWHILQAAWNDEYRWNSQLALPTQNRNGVYYRSGLGDNTAWGAWVKLLDVNNYSSYALPLTGGTMTGSSYISFNGSANNTILTNSTPTGLTYGRLQSYGTMTICGDTDGTTTEYVNITAGYPVANATSANGLSIGYNTLKWKGNTIWHTGNDGSGSGLDADLLDGNHASAFATADCGVWPIRTYNIALSPTTSWTDTGINSSSTYFPDGEGTYMLFLNPNHSNDANGWQPRYAGYFVQYTGTNGSQTEELLLQAASHAAYKRLFLRWINTPNTLGYRKLQIRSESNYSTSYTMIFKFRRII